MENDDPFDFKGMELTKEQRITVEKNKELHQLAFENRNRHGVLMSLCADLGSQDLVFLDKTRFANVYPYSGVWYQLAYGRNFNPSEQIVSGFN